MYLFVFGINFMFHFTSLILISFLYILLISHIPVYPFHRHHFTIHHSRLKTYFSILPTDSFHGWFSSVIFTFWFGVVDYAGYLSVF